MNDRLVQKKTDLGETFTGYSITKNVEECHVRKKISDDSVRTGRNYPLDHFEDTLGPKKSPTDLIHNLRCPTKSKILNLHSLERLQLGYQSSTYKTILPLGFHGDIIVQLLAMASSLSPREPMSRKETILARRQIEGMIADGKHIIIFDGNVLRVDAWLKYHPGGDKAIMHMVGRDATDEVNAYVKFPFTSMM